MPADPDHVITDVLFESVDTHVFRGIDQRRHASVIIKTLRTEAPSQASLGRLREEYEVLGRTQPDGKDAYLALVDTPTSLMLVRDEIGGELLSSVLAEGPCTVELFLAVALSLVDLLDVLHRGRLIHRDINPNKVLFSRKTGRSQLIDFGRVSQLPREQTPLTPPDRFEGTLSYLAPEQTGRMNRVVDYRTDYYAVGVILYQLVSGILPFQTHDALELVHCHLARMPRPLSSVRPDFPAPISDIVQKLLAKLGEDRYQSAAGLRADVQRLEFEYRVNSEVPSFPLGMADISERFQLPQRLYGRETEVADLLRAFDRIAETGTPELIAIAGYSGIGKSALVAELHKPIVRKRGYFTAGKFDQYRRGVPYATFAQAFQALVDQLLTESGDRIATWREQLVNALGDNAQLVVDLIPQLESIIGPQPAVSELPPDQAQHRLQRTFQRFVAVFGSSVHPLVLFVDDLQWADAASLDLLAHVIGSADTRYVLVLTAYRDNEVSHGHLAMIMLDALRSRRVSVGTVVLTPLLENQVYNLLSDAVHADGKRVRELTELVYAKTRGNPFFCFQFVSMLCQDGLITFDVEKRCWAWDVAELRSRNFTDNVVELMLGELQRLPARTQEVLALAGFLGNRFDLDVLAMVSEESPLGVEQHLWPAIQVGLIVRQGNDVRFLHDRVQEGAYRLTRDDERATVHARIGRLLRKGVTDAELEERVFDVVTHLNAGVAVIDDPVERLELAKLNCRAGEKARALTIHAAAAGYFAAGIELLSEDPWDRHYNLCLALHLGRAESEYLQGQFTMAEDLLTKIVDRAHTAIDRARARMIQISSLVTRGDSPAACAVSQRGLTDLGLNLVDEPTDADVQLGYQEIQTLLGERPPEYLLELPDATDPEMAMATRMVIFTSTAAFFTNQRLWAYHDTQMIALCLRYGAVDNSILGYVFYGFILANYLGRHREGYRYCEVARELMYKRGLTQHRGSLLYHQAVVALWVRSAGEAIDMLHQAIPALLESGNLVIAGLSARTIVTMRLLRGDRLDLVEAEADRCEAFIAPLNYPAGRSLNHATRRLIRRLRGTYETDAGANEASVDSENQIPFVIVGEVISDLAWHSMMGNHVAAYACAVQARPILWATIGLLPNHDYFFYGSISIAAVYATQPPDRRAELREWIEANLTQLTLWADGNPAGFEASRLVVAAELERLDGRYIEALRLFEAAIATARLREVVAIEAIACERIAALYTVCDLAAAAERYIDEARGAWAKWGADAKVSQLVAQQPQLKARRVVGSDTGAVLAQLDSLALAKASRAISGHILHDKLVHALLEVVLEQAGAQTGTLLLAEHGQLRPAATATVIGERVQVELVTAAGCVVPETIIVYVQRTRQPVVLADTASAHAFLGDPYFNDRRSCSLMCVPILRDAGLVGVLCLEHGTVTGAFSLERSAVLEQLAAQAAISLENANLYAEVQEQRRTLESKVTERTEELRAANAELEAFSHSVSHDLRAPARRIASFGKILLEDAATLEEEPRRLVDRIVTNAQQMTQLIEDMLLLSKTTRVELRKQPVDLAALASECVFELRERDPDRRVDAHVMPSLTAYCDRDLMRILIDNLLGNAWKFTSRRALGEIWIGATAGNHETEFCVRDNGAGFDATQAHRLFQEFQRLHTASEFEGTGLGLTIVRRIVTRHGGRVWAESIVGEGARFYFTLPNERDG